MAFVSLIRTVWHAHAELVTSRPRCPVANVARVDNVEWRDKDIRCVTPEDKGKIR